MGIPPTGRTAAVTGITIQRLQDGKVVEGWTNWDVMGTLQQLGVAPRPPQG
jgi:predicted ester cyclase